MGALVQRGDENRALRFRGFSSKFANISPAGAPTRDPAQVPKTFPKKHRARFSSPRCTVNPFFREVSINLQICDVICFTFMLQLRNSPNIPNLYQYLRDNK